MKKNIHIKEYKRKGKVNMSLLPLGSVIKLKKAKDDVWVMVTDKYVKSENLQRFVEYSGVVYPDGQIEDIEIYFNSEDIQQVFFEGYRDLNEVDFFNKLKKEYEDNNIQKISLNELEGVINQW